jgi:hypothetical protein
MIMLNAEIVIPDGGDICKVKTELETALQRISTAEKIPADNCRVSVCPDARGVRFGTRIRKNDIAPGTAGTSDSLDGELDNDDTDDLFEFPNNLGREL